MDLSTSLDCYIEANTFHNVETGVRVIGDCSHPANPNSNNFVANTFSGTQETGLLIKSGAQIGVQRCHDNRWEGVFSSLGYDCQGNVQSNMFSVNQNSLPVYKPTHNGALMFDDNCPMLTEFTGGGGSFLINSSSHNSNTASLFPNPTKDHFSLFLPELESGESFTVELTDLSGNPIFRQKVDSGIYQKNFNIHQLSAGVYLVHILSKDYRQTEKLIVTD